MAMRYHSHVRVLKQEMLSCSTHSRPPVHRPDCSELDVPSLVMGKGESLSEWSVNALEIRQKVPQVAGTALRPHVTVLRCLHHLPTSMHTTSIKADSQPYTARPTSSDNLNLWYSHSQLFYLGPYREL